jgi:hypothetical protein
MALRRNPDRLLDGKHLRSARATATYHKASTISPSIAGGVTDILTLHSRHGTDFGVASDHHGGTNVFLVFA